MKVLTFFWVLNKLQDINRNKTIEIDGKNCNLIQVIFHEKVIQKFRTYFSFPKMMTITIEYKYETIEIQCDHDNEIR